MTIRFAAARPAASRAHLSRNGMLRLIGHAANDNDACGPNGRALRAALAHFARHRIGTATHARNEARKAHFAGDRAGCQHWLEVCRAYDRRMAAALAENLAKGPARGACIK